MPFGIAARVFVIIELIFCNSEHFFLKKPPFEDYNVINSTKEVSFMENDGRRQIASLVKAFKILDIME